MLHVRVLPFDGGTGTNQAIIFEACTMKESNYHPQYPGDDEKEPQETASGACRRSEGLSSTDTGFPEKEASSLSIDLSKFPIGTKVVQVRPYVVLDIPDSYFEQCPSSPCGCLLSNLLYGCLSEEYRKGLLAYLNGREPTSRKWPLQTNTILESP